MEDHKDKKRNVSSWLSVPQFGEWDQKGAFPDYSLDFSKIREMRRLSKRDLSRASLGNEDEFINPTASAPPKKACDDEQHFVQNNSPTARKSFLSYFNCCVRA
ncbi:hypothetical protein RND81_11G227700 [Saponaria officinalis]|uniref:RIN4 pathogenic type III effector avirulence factor Avr cleavage site domain-containing protein n=1 Tax=Saponaria officinalis TaxID=3572 RepID=A0AAW1HQN2_SAPOF